jgi:hypothetical protein
MARYKLLGLIIVILMASIFMIACAADNETVPLPGVAKHFSPNGTLLEANQITMPFPHTDRFSSGEERWFLDRDTSGHLVLKIAWKNQDIASLPINGIGVTPETGEIALGGKNYDIINVNLNSDDLPNGSGWVTLQEQ